MNTYNIRKINTADILDEIEAENAENALTKFADDNPDSDYGYLRGGLNIDADTRGKLWATMQTDGGRIIADLATP